MWPGTSRRDLWLNGIELLGRCRFPVNYLGVYAQGKAIAKGRALSRMLPRLRTLDFELVGRASAGNYAKHEDTFAFGHAQAKALLARDSVCIPDPTRRRDTLYVGAVLREPRDWPSMSDRLLALCATVPAVDNAYILLTRYDIYPEVFDCDIGMAGQDRFRSRDEFHNRFSWARYGAWFSNRLRDVYPINIMPKAFYERPIEGMTLARWIAAEPRRGELAPLTPELTVWRPDWTNLPELRRRLFRANLLHWHGFYLRPDGSLMYQPNDRLPEQVPAMFDTPDEFFGGIPITR